MIILTDMKKVYCSPDTQVEYLWPEEMLCDSFTGGLEDTTEELIY